MKTFYQKIINEYTVVLLFAFVLLGQDRVFAYCGLAAGSTSCTNDECSGAEIVEFGIDFAGDTTYATLDNDPSLSICSSNGSGPTAPGVWYQVRGTGNKLEANLCKSSFDTQISVYKGSCDGLKCIGMNDDTIDESCILRSTFQWTSEIDTIYYILVHGYRSSVGKFVLHVEEFDLPTIDDCFDAQELQPGDTMNSKIEHQLPVELPACVTGTSIGGESHGIFFKITGTGTLLEASTCDKSFTRARMLVFTISQAELGNIKLQSLCNTLECIDITETACGGGGTRVLFDSALGTTYYILVMGNKNEIDDSFTLRVEQGSRADNNVCSNAIPLMFGYPMHGLARWATKPEPNEEHNNQDLHCDPYFYSPGLWYTVEGTGNILVASTCNNVTDFKTSLGLFTIEGANCKRDLRCENHGFDSCSALDSFNDNSTSKAHYMDSENIIWKSQAATTYYIYVQSAFSWDPDNWDPDMPVVGVFSLIVDMAPPIANDECRNAQPLTINSFVDGSTALASHDTEELCGNTSISVSSGVWYSVEGTGNLLNISTCNPLDTRFDTQLRVFTGDCDLLTCVEGNDDACGHQSRVIFPSMIKTKYYILVSGFDTQFGDFKLSVEESIDPNCPNAIDVVLNVTIHGTSDNATSDIDLPACDDPEFVKHAGDFAGVWYSVVGTGNRLVADACFTRYVGDEYLTVFTGPSCDKLVCLETSFNLLVTCSVGWESVANRIYYILVSEHENFELTIKEVPPNDICSGALIVEPNNVYAGSTLNASHDESEIAIFCESMSFFLQAPGLWYAVEGTDGNLTASTCLHNAITYYGASYDTQLAVFSGTCGSLSCIKNNDDLCGPLSSVTWTSELGKIYYILVYGYDEYAMGVFNLTIEAG